jgi:hypothetical protein
MLLILLLITQESLRRPKDQEHDHDHDHEQESH